MSGILNRTAPIIAIAYNTKNSFYYISFSLSWRKNLDLYNSESRRGIKGLGLCLDSLVCSRKRDCMGRAESRAHSDYTINRISADRAEARIKWNSYAISYIFPVCSGGCFGNENHVNVTFPRLRSFSRRFAWNIQEDLRAWISPYSY